MSTVEMTPAVEKWQAERAQAEQQHAPAALRALRAEAFARFGALGFPTTTEEAWRLTNVAPIAKGSWRAAPAASVDESAIAPLRLPEADVELVFVNGRLDAALSRGSAKEGVRVQNLAAAIPSANGELDRFGRIASWDERSFVALNTALAADGALVVVSPGTRAGIVHAIFYTSANGDEAHVAPRVLLLAGRASEISFAETHAGEGRYFSNAVTEIEASEGAIVEHTKVIAESSAAFHIGSIDAAEGRNATVRTRLLGLGGALVRNDVSAVMNGEGSSCTLDGLYILRDRQHFDANTRIVHASPHTDSVELYKGVLGDASRGVFNGVIIVRPDAQKITANQTNKNLILSNEAIADSNPQLEIHADDVKCTHGSTIGQLDETSMFYLRSRGIGVEEAKGILTLAFAGEVVDRVRIDSLRDRLRIALLERLTTREPA